MQLTVTADWKMITSTLDRISIAGYTGTVHTVAQTNGEHDTYHVYEYTVLAPGGYEIVASGTRLDPIAAAITVEEAIAAHVGALA